MDTILSEALALRPELQKMKDELHRRPELSFQERHTTAFLKQKLAALGLEEIDLGLETGVVALLHGAGSGPTVALRADIDALAQQEAPAAQNASETPGVMHACGHDFHTACLYGAACLLAAQRKKLFGDVVFIFQPAEEITQGAAAMVAAGLWDKLPQKPRFLFGQHCRPELPVGQVAVLPGPIMAGKSHFFITLRGVTGHGGSPHRCVDVIVPGAAIVNGIQSIVSRDTDPLDALVCSVCSIHAGSPDNFVPETLEMTGDIRALSNEVLENTQVRLKELVKGTAHTYRCGCEVRFVPEVPLTHNGPQATAIARRAAISIVGEEGVVCPRPNLGSEDFSVLGQAVPAFFYWVGTGTPGKPSTSWHSGNFYTDDNALPIGAALLARSAIEALLA